MSIVSPESLVTYEQVFEKNEQNKIKFIKDLGKFEPLNQELIIESVLVNKFNSEINQEVDFDLHISGYDGSKWVKLEKYQEIKRSVECKKKSNCTSEILVYEPFIKYHNYSIQLEVTPIKEDFFDKIYLRWIYFNSSFSILECLIRYFFLIITCVVIVLFTRTMSNIPWEFFTTEQKWMLPMLFILILFNNPFFPLCLVESTWSFTILDMIFLAIQFCTMETFWLIIIDSYNYTKRQRTFRKFYLVKIIFISIFFLTISTILIWAQVYEKNDAINKNLDTIPGFIFLMIISILCMLIYLVWILILGFNGIFGAKSERRKRKIVFMFWFILLNTLFMGVNFITGLIRRVNGSTEIFFTVFITINVYYLFLFYAFLPTPELISQIQKGYNLIDTTHNSYYDNYTNEKNKEPIIEEIPITDDKNQNSSEN